MSACKKMCRLRDVPKAMLQRIRRRRVIGSYLKGQGPMKVQLGAGSNILPGWLNTDMNPRAARVLYLDAAQKLPFPDACLNYILSEHIIEHLTYEAGTFLLGECLRVLKTSGRIRFATPDFDKILALRATEKTDLQLRYLRWHVQNFFPGQEMNECLVINNAFCGFGHRFLYDEATLRAAMEHAGFVDVTRWNPGESDDENLAGVECRTRDEMLSFSALVLEARKPGKG